MQDGLDTWLDGAPVVIFNEQGDFRDWLDGAAIVGQGGQAPVRRRATVSFIE